MAAIKFLSLASGHRMPILGLGTYAVWYSCNIKLILSRIIQNYLETIGRECTIVMVCMRPLQWSRHPLHHQWLGVDRMPCVLPLVFKPWKDFGEDARREIHPHGFYREKLSSFGASERIQTFVYDWFFRTKWIVHECRTFEEINFLLEVIWLDA